ncbi:MAG: ABC transporter permease, partial [Planctomycetes bacterium]|nr:ABC transporter permease [Planctomycetota bacterium]
MIRPGPAFGLAAYSPDSAPGFPSGEEERGIRVVLLGAAVAETLLGKADPLGEIVRIKNINFRVIGVLKTKGDQGWFNPDDMVLVPYPCAMKNLLGQSHLSEIDIHVKSGVETTAV